jgi:hypothetical protein
LQTQDGFSLFLSRGGGLGGKQPRGDGFVKCIIPFFNPCQEKN